MKKIETNVSLRNYIKQKETVKAVLRLKMKQNL